MIQMEDPQAPPVGTKGTVIGVDDAGSIMVRWDNGSSLNVAYGAESSTERGPLSGCWSGSSRQTVRDQILAIRDTGETNMFDVPMVQQHC
jgi:hypothetical protein